MRLSEKCKDCLFSKEVKITPKPEYLEAVARLLDSWEQPQSAPYMEHCINELYRSMYGERARYGAIKKQFNDLLLQMEDALKEKIESSDDSLKTALFMCRTGNYIDLAALKNVSSEEFLKLLNSFEISEEDERVYSRFIENCSRAKTLLLAADNCGEIVLDRLMLEQLKKRFPGIAVSVLVRGFETLNDVTPEDAEYVGISRVGKIISSGCSVAGVEYDMLTEEAKAAVDGADIIIAKGQGNYESLTCTGRHVFFLFLCKCDVFTEHFKVPRFTGMFIEESADKRCC